MHLITYKRLLCAISLLLLFFVYDSKAQFLRFGSKEYYIGRNTFVRSYEAAEEQCLNLESTLAVVNSEEVERFLVEQIGNLTRAPFSFFIGLRRVNPDEKPNSFQWRDESQLTWSNWLPGEPNNSPVGGDGMESCVIMGWTFSLDSTFQWRDVLCNFIARFICEKTIKSSSNSEVQTRSVVPTTRQRFSTSISSVTATTTTTTTIAMTSSSTAANSIATISNTQQEIIIYAAIGGGALLVAVIIIIIVTICHHRRKKDHKSKSHDPNVIYETIEESSHGSRQPVYNEIYKSSDFNNGQNGGYHAPVRHGANTYSQIYLRPDGSLYQDHLEPPPVPSTLPKREKKSKNKREPKA